MDVIKCLQSVVLVEMGYKPNDLTNRFTSKENVIFLKRMSEKSLTMSDKEILDEFKLMMARLDAWPGIEGAVYRKISAADIGTFAFFPL